MTAKLRELLEAASPGPWIWGDITVKTENAEIRLASDMDAKLAALAPDLARLVLQLSGRLASAAIGQHYYHRSPGTEYELPTADQCAEEQECRDNRAALDAVEEL